MMKSVCYLFDGLLVIVMLFFFAAKTFASDDEAYFTLRVQLKEPSLETKSLRGGYGGRRDEHFVYQWSYEPEIPMRRKLSGASTLAGRVSGCSDSRRSNEVVTDFTCAYPNQVRKEIDKRKKKWWKEISENAQFFETMSKEQITARIEQAERTISARVTEEIQTQFAAIEAKIAKEAIERAERQAAKRAESVAQAKLLAIFCPLLKDNLLPPECK